MGPGGTGAAAHSVLDPIERAVADIAAGRPVVVVDDEDRENEGDLVLAASRVTPESMAFMVRHCSGLVCVPMQGSDLDRLQLPPMTDVNQDKRGTAYAVSTDARSGVTTGISAADRARTVRVLVDPSTQPGDLARPGHVIPLRAVDGGVLRRRGHTEAAVDLARLAGLPPAGVICEIVEDDGSMMRLRALRRFADRHGLGLVSIADLVAHRLRTESFVERVVDTRMPLPQGVFRAVGYRSRIDGAEHVVLMMGDLAGADEAYVAVHGECPVGDLAFSFQCDCRRALEASLKAAARSGRGVVLYLRHDRVGQSLVHVHDRLPRSVGGELRRNERRWTGTMPDLLGEAVAEQILADLRAPRPAVDTLERCCSS